MKTIVKKAVRHYILHVFSYRYRTQCIVSKLGAKTFPDQNVFGLLNQAKSEILELYEKILVYQYENSVGSSANKRLGVTRSDVLEGMADIELLLMQVKHSLCVEPSELDAAVQRKFKINKGIRRLADTDEGYYEHVK